MTHIKQIIVSVFIFASLAFAAQCFAKAEQQQLTLTVTDRSDVETGVSKQTFHAVNKKFIDTSNRIAVTTKMIEIAIPVSQMVSIQYTGRDEGKSSNVPIFDVTYRTDDKIRKITGKISLSSIQGDSEFGTFSLSLSKLRSVTFNHPKAADTPEAPLKTKVPKKTPKAKTKKIREYTAKMMLTDGTALQLANLQRHESYYYSAPAPPGFYSTASGRRYVNAKNIIFVRGESTITLDFGKLKRLDFGKEGQVSMTLTNGKNTTAHLSKKDREALDGFNGRQGSIRYFVPVSAIASVELADSEKE